MTDLTQFENNTGDNSGSSTTAESEKSDITVLQGKGDSGLKGMRERASQGPGVAGNSGDDTPIEVL